jgi:hypothetical protein
MAGEAAGGERIEHVKARFHGQEGGDQQGELRRPRRVGRDELGEESGRENQQLGIADAAQEAAAEQREAARRFARRW